MNCSRIQKHLGAYLDAELDSATAAQISAHLRDCATCRAESVCAREFDERLREVDGYYGAAPSLVMPPDFLSRVIEQARTTSLSAVSAASAISAAKQRPIWNWFLDFSLPVRLAVVSSLLVATLGGVRAGQVITGLIAPPAEQSQPAIHLDMTPAEQSLVMLMRSEGIALTNQPNPPGVRQPNKSKSRGSKQ